MKRNTGITVISLVVSIIVLIILAGISINMLVGDNGIITMAQKAKENVELAKVEEETALNELYEEMNQEGIDIGDEESNEKDKIIKSLQEQLEEQEKEIEELKRQLMIYKLAEGDYIKYDTGVEGVGVITCRVLYTASSKYGLQIISDKNVGEDITLGGTTFTEAQTSYNNAIQTLNNEAEKYINEQYATDARCVGSVPTVENGIFVKKNSETNGPVSLQFSYNGSGIIDVKNTDENYIIDQRRLQEAEIKTSGEYYWMASRYVESLPAHCHLYVLFIQSNGNLNRDVLLSVDNISSSYPNIKKHGLRPCILLRNDIKITGGDGKTEETAYTIGI